MKSAIAVENPALNFSYKPPSSALKALTPSKSDIRIPIGAIILLKILPNVLAPLINGSKNLNNPAPAPLIKSVTPVAKLRTGFNILPIAAVALKAKDPLALTFIASVGS